MADLTAERLGKEGKKWESLESFRTRKGNIRPQALRYAMDKDLVDFIKVGPKASAILLTEKSMDYTPKSSPARDK